MSLDELTELIERAAKIAGSQKKLADLLEIAPANLIQMKQGKRPANWRVRGGLRAILGEDPARAFMAAMAEELEQSEKADEKKAADSFKAILAAFPSGGNGWTRLDVVALHVLSRLRRTIHSTLGNLLGNAVLPTNRLISRQSRQVLLNQTHLILR